MTRILESRWTAALVLGGAALWTMGVPGRLGIFSDDWTLVPRLAWLSAGESVRYAFDLGITSHRPLLAGPLLIQAAVVRTVGLAGGFVLLAVLLAANAFLLAELSRRRLSPALALFAALLFLLHPADTTHVWLVSFVTVRFAMLLALLACAAFCAQRLSIALLLLTASGLIYEISPFVFLLAPWFASGGRTSDVRRGAWTLVPALAMVVGARALWPDVRVADTAALWSIKASLETYLVTFPQTWLLAVVKWPVRATLRALEPQWRGLWLTLVLPCAALAAWLARREGVSSPPAMRLSRNSRRAVWSCDAATFGALEALVWASLATCAAAALSFAAAPNFEWGHVTRINYFATPGAALVLTISLASVHRWARLPLLRLGTWVAGAILMSAFFVFQVSIRSDYVDAAAQQRSTLRTMLAALDGLPSETTLVLYHREHAASRRAAAPFTLRADWEARGLAYALYGPAITGLGVWDAAAVREIEVDLARQPTGAPFVLYDLDQGTATWLRASAASGAPLVSVRRQARAYVESQ